MMRFTIFARSGFYLTCLGVAGQMIASVTSMTYHTGKLIDKGLFSCVMAGFLLSFLAILIGGTAKVAFAKAYKFYIMAGLSLIVSGYILAISCLTFLRGILDRFGM